MATVLFLAVTYMPKTACPYCKKTYEKAKHLENHIDKKHSRLVGLLSTAKSQMESDDQEGEIRLPENPLDMTPDLLSKLSAGQILLWKGELLSYRSRAQVLNKAFSFCGISPATSSYKLSADMTLPPGIDDRLGELNELEVERICRKSIEPAFSEMTELIAGVQKRCSSLEDELKNVRSLMETLMIVNLGKTDRSYGIRAG